MKKYFLLIFTMLFVFGCARVNLGLDESGQIVADRAGGYTSPERYLNIKEKQGKVDTVNVCYKQIQYSVISKDFETVEKLTNTVYALKNNTLYPSLPSYSSSSGKAMLPIKNTSEDFDIKIGQEIIKPGQISAGLYPFYFGESNTMNIEWINNKTKQTGTMTLTAAKINMVLPVEIKVSY